MDNKQLKEYLMEKYKDQIVHYKMANDSKNAVLQLVFQGRIELLEGIFRKLFNWQIIILNEKQRITIVLESEGTSKTVLCTWGLNEIKEQHYVEIKK